MRTHTKFGIKFFEIGFVIDDKDLHCSKQDISGFSMRRAKLVCKTAIQVLVNKNHKVIYVF